MIPSYGHHSTCYKNFIAISKPKIKPKTSNRFTKISTRSETASPLLPCATGVLPSICIFCNKGRKKNEVHGKNLEKIEKHETKIAIRNKAKMLIDELMILKIGNYNFGEGPNFVAKGVIITMNVKETIYIKKINLVISKILHWKSLLAMQETK